LENYEASAALASASPWQILQQNFRMIRHGGSVALSFLVILFLYILSVFLILVGLLKPLFPKNIGLWIFENPFGILFGFNFMPDSGKEILGYWIIPLSIILGAALFVVTSRLSRLHLVAITEKQFHKIRNLSIAILLVVLVFGVFVAKGVTVVSGADDTFVLAQGKTKLGILVVQEEATATFQEKSHWIGPVIVKLGSLTIENEVTVNGSVVLMADSLELGENAIIRGNVYLFAGGLSLRAIVRDDVILFAGGLNLAENAIVRDDAILFAGPVNLREEAKIQGDSLLFAGPMDMRQNAIAQGELILFAGGLDVGDGAIVDDDVLLFAGSLHLSPQAQIDGDAIVLSADSTLEANSLINGKLLYDPKDGGEVFQDKGAEVKGGVSSPGNIITTAGWRTGVFFIKHTFKRLIPPVLIILAAFFLVRFWRRRQTKEFTTTGRSPGCE
jgi:acetyltransferase-like isoleucine patch superfamily enzyme